MFPGAHPQNAGEPQAKAAGQKASGFATFDLE
jgi:hypothetical protein